MAESKADDFETSLKRLDQIVTKLESEDVTLDQSVELYKQGKELARRCTALLNAARKSIEDASRDDSENGAAEPLTDEDAEDEQIPF